MPFRLRDAAKVDLAAIWLNTADRWGVDQAEAYVRAIETRIGRICDYPESYPEYEGPADTFRKAPSGEHLIFYVVEGLMVDIVRILHNRMDADDRL